MEIPFSDACERNKEPILEVLKQVIKPQHQSLLEIGSGTGQHAQFLAPFFPHVAWRPTDRNEVLPGLHQRFKNNHIKNLLPAQKFQVGVDDIPKFTYDIIFTANTFHIMAWKECKTLMKLMGHRLQEHGKVVIYGPFNYEGKFTSPSNEEFDQYLRAQDPASGIRAFEDVNKAMIKNGFKLVKDYSMPANNHMLVYSRLKFVKAEE